jgi:hypothetical protein
MNRAFKKALLASSIAAISHYSMANSSITAAEAYIDNAAMPEGTGTVITTTQNGNIYNIVSQLDVSGLSEGVHVLYTRAKNDSNEWSAPIAQVFVIDAQPPAGEFNKLTQARIRLDGADVTSQLSDYDIALAEGEFAGITSLVSRLGLASPGVHRIGVSLKDNTGSWSPEIQQVFITPDFPANPVNSLASAEYFIGSDPGEGNATALNNTAFSTSMISELVSQSISSDALAIGLHKIGFRSKDEDGYWSPTFIQHFELKDFDNDGLHDLVDSDDDNDGLSDLQELVLGTNPLDADSDDDLVLDGDDAFPLDNTEQLDTDGDGIGDNSDPTPGFGGKLQFVDAAISVDEGQVSVDINIERIDGSQGEVSVSVISQHGTADAADYTAVSQTITFADNDLSETVTVTLNADETFEISEQFSLKLQNIIGDASIGVQDSIQITILDDDIDPDSGVVGFNGAFTAAENDSIATVSVARINGSTGSVSIDIATSDGSAKAGEDYEALSQTLTFLDGEVTKSVDITLLDNNVYEANESLNLTLSNAQNVSLGTVQTSLTITDDDPVPMQGDVSFAASSMRINEADGTAVITIERANGDDGAVQVTLISSDGSAQSGIDYQAINQSVTFADGVSSSDITINLVNDNTFRSERRFTLNLSAPQSGLALGNITEMEIIIDEDDAFPKSVIEMSGGSYSLDESEGLVSIDFIRSINTNEAVRVYASVTEGSAIFIDDLSDTSAWINFAQDQISASLEVPITVDSTAEADESFTVSLTAVEGNAMIGASSSSVITITDATLPPVHGRLGFAGETYSSTVDNAAALAIVVQRVNGADGRVSIDWNSGNYLLSESSSSFAGETTGTLVFEDAEVSRTLYLTEGQFTDLSTDTSLSIRLSNPLSGAQLAGVVKTTVTILANVVDGIDTESPKPATSGGGGGGSASWLLLLLLSLPLFKRRK